MNVHLRKLRGVVGTGLIWCPVWAAMFAVLTGVVSIFIPIKADVGPGRMIAIIGWVGFVSGGLFGILMAVAENGKPIRNLSLRRAALWGMLASAVFPVLTQRADQVFWTCPFGLIVALALAAFARKAARREALQPRRWRDRLSACVLTPLRDAINAPAR